MDNKSAQDVLLAGQPSVNLTKNLEGIVSQWRRNKEGFFVQVEALLAVCTLLYAIQVVFGWWRRCSSNVYIKYTLWLAYTFTPTVAIYTLGFTGSFISTGHDLKELSRADVVTLSFWSVILVCALGSSDSMTAYDVDDNKRYTRHLVRQALYMLNIVAIFRLYTTEVWGLWFWWDFMLTASLISFLYPHAVVAVCTGMGADSFSDLYLQSHMKNEHLKSTSYDPVTLQGYNYLIYHAYGTLPVHVSKVWLSKEGILGSSDGARLKEVCLSFALFRLLRRRFFGAACPEAALRKTHDLVFRGLLSSKENHEYAYRVIETELAFAYDHFFTSSPSFGTVNVICRIQKLCLYLIIIGYEASMTTSIVRSIVTVVILLVLLALELLQLYILLSSDYLRVTLACRSSTKPLRGTTVSRIQNKLPQLFGHWQNKIGQHSLLKDLHSRSITADVMGSLTFIFCFPAHPVFLRGIFNPGVKGPDRMPLTCRVKKAIAQTLKSSDGHLSNGVSSLQRNHQVQLSEEFLLGSDAGDMLIWHIATEYCDISQSRQTARQDDSALSNCDVATSLSSYCAYLMAFVPELLPDHQLETMEMFHRTREEALKHLQKDKTLEEKYAKLTNYGENYLFDTGKNSPPQDVNVFEKGIPLGKRLEGITDDGRRWKILADFWTEMILYIAPSNNARDHIRHLANGGEFLTHLWALLTHAGILERDQKNVVNTQNAGANHPHQEQEQSLQPDQPHTEDTQNPVNHHEIEVETATAGGQEADRGAHVHGNDSNASSSANNQTPVEIV